MSVRTAVRPLPLESLDDRVLVTRWQRFEDRAARDAMVRRHMPLAKRLARRYGRSGELTEDLGQVASIGLVKAVDRFDPDRGLTFSTFAVPTILGELKRYLRDTTWAVRVPRDLQESALRVEREAQRLERGLGRAPTVGELAREMNTEPESVVEAMAAAGAHRAVSLDAPRGNGGDDEDQTQGELVGSEDLGLTGAEHRAVLDPLLSVLPEREREILRLRFAEDMTQSEIGARLDISQMHVSRLIRRALAKVQDGARTSVSPV